MNETPNKSIEIVLLVCLAFLWGSSFTLIKVAVDTIPPATMVMSRLLLGTTLLFALVWYRGLSLPSDRKLWGAFAVQGLIQSALPFTLISWGEQFIDSGLAGLLNSLPPVFTFLIVFVVLKQGQAPFSKFIGVIIGLIGVLTVMGPEVLYGARENVLGQLAVLASSLCYGMASIWAKRFADVPAPVTAACSMLMALLMITPIALVVDQPWTLEPTLEAIWSVVALGVLSTAVAMIIFFRLVKTLGSVGVTSGSYLRAGFSVLLGIVILGEQLTWNLGAGMVFILLSVALMTGQLKLGRDRTA